MGGKVQRHNRNKIRSSIIIKIMMFVIIKVMEKYSLKKYIKTKYKHKIPKQQIKKWPGSKGKCLALTRRLTGKGQFLFPLRRSSIVKGSPQRKPLSSLLSIWTPPEAAHAAPRLTDVRRMGHT